MKRKRILSFIMILFMLAGCFSNNVYVYGDTTYRIKTTASEGGSITPSFIVNEGGTATVYITPNEGYSISSVTVNNDKIELTGNSYEIKNVDKNYEIQVSFSKKSYKITATASEGGKIYGNKTALFGDSATYNFSADPGYELKAVYVDDVEVEVKNNKYVFEKVAAEHSVYAEFSAIECEVSIGECEHGKIKVSTDEGEITGDTKVPYGTVVYFSNTADDYYIFSNYTINGNVYSGSEYKITGKVSVAAVFKPKTYSVNVKNLGSGTVTTTAGNQISAGTEVTITAHPDEGYKVDKMIVNGIDVTDKINENNNYVTSETWEGLNVDVTFVKQRFSINTKTEGGGNIVCYNEAEYGDEVLVSFLPEKGFILDKVYIDGTLTEVYDNACRLYDIRANHEIKAVFTEKICKINVFATGRGSASESTEVHYGGEYRLVVTPDTGYQVDEVKVNGVPLTVKGNIYEIKDITDDCVITVTFEPNEVAKPVINKVESKGVHSIKIIWDNVEGAEGFEIYRKAEGKEKYKKIADVRVGYFEQSYTDVKRQCGTRYYYKVKAYKDRNGEKLYGEISDEKSGRAVPDKVSGLKLKTIGVSGIKATWNKCKGVRGYQIYISESAKGTYRLVGQVEGSKNTTYTLKGLSIGTFYYVKVVAYRTSGSDYIYGKNSVVKKQETAHLTEVTNVFAKKIKTEYVRITWDKKSGADGYVIYWNIKKKGEYKKIAAVKGGSTTEYHDKFRFWGMNHYKVVAYKIVNGKKKYSCMSERAGVDVIILPKLY